MTGSSIAHYRITAKLGEGGMGAVYRATDTKLGRDVAIKVLPPALASDADYIARFQREAQVLASLNHPNIAAIYGLEDNAIVMELVEGSELKGPLPLDEVIRIAKQIADALEAAHERGIVHRDLKPANIRITPDGTAKVLDFGLAKATEPAQTAAASAVNSPTLTIHATTAGVILGTAAYMSPEQAAGKAVDRRADIWSFGVVLWEMIAGRRMFDGETVSHVLAHVLTGPIDLTPLPEGPVRDLVGRCLDRNVKTRLRDIGEARVLLSKPLETRPAASSAAPARLPWMLAAALALSTVAACWLAFRTPAESARPYLRLRADLSGGSLAGRTELVLSRDGGQVLYRAMKPDAFNSFVYLQPLNGAPATAVPGTAGATSAALSPDGRWIFFYARQALRKVGVEGGSVLEVGRTKRIHGIDWLPDGSIVTGQDEGGLLRFSADGGQPQPLTNPSTDGQTTHRYPIVLPGGAVLYTAHSATSGFDDARIEALPAGAGKRVIVLRGGYYARFLPVRGTVGYLLYVSRGTVFAAPFDAAKLAATGPAVPFLPDVTANVADGNAMYGLSPSGLLIYRTGADSGTEKRTVVLADRSGKVERLTTVPGLYHDFRFSPDGSRIALVEGVGNSQRIGIYDLRRDFLSYPNLPDEAQIAPVWAPDGEHILYRSQSSNALWWARWDGSGTPHKLAEGLWGTFTPDGKYMVLVSIQGNNDIWLSPIDLTDRNKPVLGKPQLLVQTPGTDTLPAVSPDGQWLSFTSDHNGTFEVYVTSMRGEGRWPVSSGGARDSAWAGNDRLTYRGFDGRIMAVDLKRDKDGLLIGKPYQWTPVQTARGPAGFVYTMHPDGKRVVLLEEPRLEAGRGTSISALVNVAEELRRRAPLP